MNEEDKERLIREIQISLRVKNGKLRRGIAGLEIVDKDGVRCSKTDILPVYLDGDIYRLNDLREAAVEKILEKTYRTEVKVVKDRFDRMWLFSLYDDRVYDWRVSRAWIKVENMMDAENYYEKYHVIMTENNCRAPYFYTESLRSYKFVKPIPAEMTADEEFMFIVEHTKIV